jgi:DNA-binding FadR family transcriptional regulator
MEDKEILIQMVMTTSEKNTYLDSRNFPNPDVVFWCSLAAAAQNQLTESCQWKAPPAGV